MHSMKVMGRRMEEGVGLRRSVNAEADVVENRRLIEANTKHLKALIKLIEEGQKTWSDMGKKYDQFHAIADGIPALRKTETTQRVDQLLTNLTMLPDTVVPRSVDNAVAVTKTFIKESEKTTTIEYKFYDEARMEADMYADKMRRATHMTDEKRDENELKKEKADEVFHLRNAEIHEKMHIILNAAPQIYELCTLAFAEVHRACAAAMQPSMDSLANIAESKRSLLEASFESLGLNNKAGTPVATIEG